VCGGSRFGGGGDLGGWVFLIFAFVFCLGWRRGGVGLVLRGDGCGWSLMGGGDGDEGGKWASVSWDLRG